MANKYGPQDKYDAANTFRISIKLNRKTEKDIIEWLNKQDKKQTAIKSLIRADIERNGETMKKLDLNKLDIRDLSEKAQRFFETSDIEALQDLFGDCKTAEEIDAVANDLYDEFFGE